MHFLNTSKGKLIKSSICLKKTFITLFYCYHKLENVRAQRLYGLTVIEQNPSQYMYIQEIKYDF